MVQNNFNYFANPDGIDDDNKIKFELMVTGKVNYFHVVDVNMNKVLVFKTSVCNQTDISKLKVHLDNVIKNGKWNFDLEDCDKILRVESKRNITEAIFGLLNKHGFECTELDD